MILFVILNLCQMAVALGNCDNDIFNTGEGEKVIFKGKRAKLGCEKGYVLAGTGPSSTKCTKNKHGEYNWKNANLTDECITCPELSFDDENVAHSETMRGRRKHQAITCPAGTLYQISNSK